MSAEYVVRVAAILSPVNAIPMRHKLGMHFCRRLSALDLNQPPQRDQRPHAF
jgi:hypothetical protein